ncbi:MAG: hypothetical protein AAB597_03040 [Patescibacteria group bacterium]
MEPETKIPNNSESNSREGLGGYFLGAAVILIIGLGGYFMLSSKTAEAPGNAEVAMEVPSDLESGEASTSTPVTGADTKETMVKEEPMGDEVFHALVSFTKDGFVPKETTIKKGETVRFVNNSDTDSWPASAIHPTHSIYPQKSSKDCLGSSFDACRGLKPGEFWEFTFDSVGTWRFHDHLSASKTGSIVVK